MDLIRLPPYNCDLSAIEYVWKDTKDYIRKNNLDQSLLTVQRTAEQFMRNYNTSYWIAHVNHVKRFLSRLSLRKNGYHITLLSIG